LDVECIWGRPSVVVFMSRVWNGLALVLRVYECIFLLHSRRNPRIQGYRAHINVFDAALVARSS
jgi:diadenosine tetraphosphatase ApaH/serine/threonine PP2A family protein phosphatase